MKRKKNDWYEKLPMIDKLPLWFNLEKELERYNVHIGIDKLKLCYRVINDCIIKELEDSKPEWYNFYDFDLHRIESKYHSDVYQILIKDFNKDNEIETVVFGELRFNLKVEENNEINNNTPKEKKVWIYIDNQTLYTKNRLVNLDYIVENLGLRLRNLTEIEIFIDSTRKNLAKLIKRMIRNKEYTAYLNEKKIIDRLKDREEIVFTHSGNMDRYKYMTVNIFSQKALKNKVDGISICAYDKRKECLNKGKDYILDKYDATATLHRIEIRVGNEKFKEYCNTNKIELVEFLFRDKGFLYATFEWFFEKVIYFLNENKEKITIPEIVL